MLRPGKEGSDDPPARRRGNLTAVLQARVTRTEHDLLEELARQQGLTISEAVRLGAWSYLLARGATPRPDGSGPDGSSEGPRT